MKTHIGPLGFPRLTSAGPLVGNTSQFSEAISNEDLNNLMAETAGELGYDRQKVLVEGDLTDEQKDELIATMADRIYPRSTPTGRAKNARFRVCISNKWAKKWAAGLANKTDTANPDNDFEMARLKMKGCVGITESNVPDDIRLIPDEFK